LDDFGDVSSGMISDSVEGLGGEEGASPVTKGYSFVLGGQKKLRLYRRNKDKKKKV